MHPLVLPNQAGSTLFIYHANAVQEMRDMSVRVGALTTAPKRAKLIELWSKVAGVQLGATLKHLAPANDIGLFAVTVNTTGTRWNAGRRMHM
jgi:hypothetical protein